jgi:phosphate transport system substrate-binding protein
MGEENMRHRKTRLALTGLAAVVLAAMVTAVGVAAVHKLKGRITADGSSTVGPYTAAAAELFRKKESDVQITVGISGTGGGFQRFCNGETDMSNASRRINQTREVPNCVKNGVKYVAFTVANDGLSVVVNKDVTFTNCISTEQLKRIWQPGSKIDNWKDVDSKWPDKKMKLFGPGTDSGTFDFFTLAINGREKASRSDFTPSENDEVLVRGVSQTDGAMGYFGYSYYIENKSQLKLLAVDSGAGCIAPNVKTVQSLRYKPLSRPLFIYAKRASFKRAEVQGFVKFMIDNEREIAKAARFISLTDKQLRKAKYQYTQAVRQAKAST